MAYSLDLRKRVINYLENGGSPSKAAEVFQVGRASIYRWLERVEPIQVKRRNRKLDYSALEQALQINPGIEINRHSQKIWGKTERDILCSQENENHEKKNHFGIAKETDKKELTIIEN